MSTQPETPITFRSLYESPLITLRDYCCRAGRGGPTAEEHSDICSIVLMRRGAFCKHFGRRTVTADVNQAVFFSKGSTYRVSHPADCGDRGLIFVPSPRMLCDMVRELDPSIDDQRDRPLPFVTGACDSGIFWRRHELTLTLTAGAARAPDPVWVDVTALQLVADVLEAAYARTDLPRKCRSRKRTEADQQERVEAAKLYLAGHLSEAVTLASVANAVHVSPFHLARLFQQSAGVPIHRYLTRLRLRASLERLAEGAKDLTTLALDLGFSSHSHFTDVFRREFGRTPSDVRRTARHRALAEMSKNLKV